MWYNRLEEVPLSPCVYYPKVYSIILYKHIPNITQQCE